MVKYNKYTIIFLNANFYFFFFAIHHLSESL